MLEQQCVISCASCVSAVTAGGQAVPGAAHNRRCITRAALTRPAPPLAQGLREAGPGIPGAGAALSGVFGVA